MQQSEQFFSNKQLKRMIIPLFIEQTRHLVIWLVLIHNIANAMEPMISNTDIKFVTLISSPLRLAPRGAVHLT